jgi:hypothetical protein
VRSRCTEVTDDAVEDERVTLCELFGGLPGGEDRHGTLILRVAEGPDHQQGAGGVKLVEAACGG